QPCYLGHSCRTAVCVMEFSSRQKRQRDQMRGDGKSDLDDAAGAYGALAAGKIDLDILMIKECMVEGVERFIYGFLPDKEQPACMRLIGKDRACSRRCH